MAPRRTDRARICALMAALAAGEDDKVFDLITEYHGRLRATVLRHLRSFGRHDLISRPDDVEFLVLTAAFVLLERAGSWDPAGAMPWTWADKAIRSAIGQDIGHATLPFDDLDPYGSPAGVGERLAWGADRSTLTPSSGGMAQAAPDDGLEELRALGRRDGRFLLLVEALQLVGSERDRTVHVQYGVQKHLGDPSPARTVALESGLRADHVRQIDRRMRMRLAELAGSDDRFAPLIGLGWFDEPDRSALGRVA